MRDRRPLSVPTAAEAERESRLCHSAIMAKADVPGPMCVPTTAADVTVHDEVRVGPQALDHLADQRRLLVVDRRRCVTKYSSSYLRLLSSTKRCMAAMAFFWPRTLA